MALAVFAIGAQTSPDSRRGEERDRKMAYDGAPLLKAKLAFETARSRVLENRYQDAAAALSDARRALADFESGNRGPHAETSQFIREEVAAYEQKIARLHDKEDAVDRIEFWLRPVDRWYQASLK